MKDISYIAAFPKSGITYLNFMLFHVLFDSHQDVARIDSDYIFDVHEVLGRVPPPSATPRYLKTHFPFGPSLPLRDRMARAVCLIRDPIDVMMSVWDFRHLTGEAGLLTASPPERAQKFEQFARHWVTTGGMIFPWAGSWASNVKSWLDQTAVPALFVQYERLKQQPREELERVLAFLERKASPERIAAAVEAGKVDNMRKIETDEVAKGVTGVFYRPAMAAGYAQGFRFVGKLHQGSAEKVLSPGARQHAELIFNPILERVMARAA